MKGILNKTNRGWVVKQVVKEGTHAKLINQYPLIDNGHIDGLKLYDSNEGLEVDFEIVTDYDNNGPDHFPKYAKILTPEEAELKDWDVTLNDGLENEVWDEKLIKDLINETVPEPFATPEELQEKPYVSDDFQIGPDGAYEHTEDMMQNEDYQPDYSITNLDVITYRNGDAIPEVKDPKEWSELATGAWCYYDNDPSKGILYNWYAVNDPRGLAPLGWKIPNDKEINLLDLKINPQFNGYRSYDGNFINIGAGGDWWSSSESSTVNTWSRFLYYYSGNVYSYYSNKLYGFSVRCLRDDDLFKNKKNMTPREKAKDELIKVLWWQVMDLTTMSKIELGDDVIAEIRRLNKIIKIGEKIEKL